VGDEGSGADRRRPRRRVAQGVPAADCEVIARPVDPDERGRGGGSWHGGPPDRRRRVLHPHVVAGEVGGVERRGGEGCLPGGGAVSATSGAGTSGATGVALSDADQGEALPRSSRLRTEKS